MPDNLPNQSTTDDTKLKELEKELQDLERRAQGELQQTQQAEIGKTPTPTPQPAATQQKPVQTPSPSVPPTTKPPVSPKPPAKGGGGMKTAMWVAIVFLAFSVAGAAGYYLGANRVKPTPSPTPAPTVTPEPTAMPTEGWETFQSEDGWAIRYPEGVKVTENAVVSFMMFGPTQKEGTEFYDGISLTIRSGSLGGITLKAFVDDKVEEIEGDAVSEVTAGPTLAEIADLSGYRLTATGLGTFEYYYLPLGESRYLEIVDGSQDPAGEGYKETVETMLDTMQVTSISLSPAPSPTTTATPSATP